MHLNCILAIPFSRQIVLSMFDRFVGLAFTGLNFETCRATIYFLKFDKRNTRKKRDICSTSTIKPTERSHCCHSSVLLLTYCNFEHISHFFQDFPVLALNK